MKSPTAFAAAAATVLFLSSCTSGSPADGHTDHEHGAETSAAAGTSSAALPADVNDADVTFATDMIPHHQQAVELSALVPIRSTDPAVLALAAEISAAQTPEIDTMKAFLMQWNRGDQASAHDGHDMGAMGMQGMVDDTTMTRLESSKGNEFDTLWLTSMIGHHEGAIEMADAELANGKNADAKKLAQQIADVQKREIDQMRTMGKVTQGG